jgi:hypothetical protein
MLRNNSASCSPSPMKTLIAVQLPGGSMHYERAAS